MKINSLALQRKARSTMYDNGIKQLITSTREGFVIFSTVEIAVILEDTKAPHRIVVKAWQKDLQKVVRDIIKRSNGTIHGAVVNDAGLGLETEPETAAEANSYLPRGRRSAGIALSPRKGGHLFLAAQEHKSRIAKGIIKPIIDDVHMVDQAKKLSLEAKVEFIKEVPQTQAKLGSELGGLVTVPAHCLLTVPRLTK